ncbi:MAG: phosphotransferase [Candidatus Bathyarchaeota archaeon]
MSIPFVEKILLRNYDLGKIHLITPLESGFQSDNVKVATETGIYVIKLLHQSTDYAHAIMMIHDILTSHGLKAARPIRTITTDFVVSLNPNQSLVVQSFMPGKPIFRENKEEMYGKIDWYGKQIGIFHRISKNIPIELVKQRVKIEKYFVDSIKYSIEASEEALKTLPEHEKNRWIKKRFGRWKKKVHRIIEHTKLSKGIIQGDLKPGDIFIEDGKLTGIIDFWSSSYDYFMSELGSWSYYTRLYDTRMKQKFKQFIRPYLNQSTIPIEELRLLPFFIETRGYDQIFYFAHRLCHNITQGLDEDDDEGNIIGYVDGIKLVESAVRLDQDYFYDLAGEAYR